jgi:cobalt/nickel transport protein
VKTTVKLWIGIGILILLAPLGLYICGYFKGGSAWGEWGPDALKGLAGYIPEGLKKLSGLWNAPISGYGFGRWEGYMASALIGVLLTACAALLIGKQLTRKK